MEGVLRQVKELKCAWEGAQVDFAGKAISAERTLGENGWEMGEPNRTVEHVFF